MKKLGLFLVMMTVMLVVLAGCTIGPVVEVTTPIPNTQIETVTPNEQIKVPGFNININVPGPNPLVNTAGTQGSTPGIVIGIWHGIISPITLIVSFINPNIQMYEVHNDGSQYNLGFLVGVAIVFLILGIIGGSRRH